MFSNDPKRQKGNLNRVSGKVLENESGRKFNLVPVTAVWWDDEPIPEVIGRMVFDANPSGTLLAARALLLSGR